MYRVLYIIISILVFCCEVKTQTNLVPNGSFEEYNQCPNNYDQLNRVKYWYKPTLGTSDYFNACDVPLNFDVPSNVVGYQNAKDGSAYVGIVAYGPMTDYKEYVQVKLNSTLESEKRYCVSFYVSLSDSSIYSIAKFALLFSPYAVTDFGSVNVLNEKPQIIEATSIEKKDDWFLIEKEYLANGTENYITIGNFDNLTNVEANYIGGPYEMSYYYIDDVKIYECGLGFPNVFTPNNDGVNDVFFIADNVDFEIYNRWGTKVFQTSAVNHYWDGHTTSGEPCVDGTYFYIIETEEKTQKGCVQLIR